MKRILSVLIVALLVLSPLLANQFIFPLGHPIYEETDALYISEGRATPSGMRPWSENEARGILDSVNPRTDTGRALKAHIESYFKPSESWVPSYGATLSPTASVHTNPSSFSEYSDLFGEVYQDRSFLDVSGGIGYGRYAALFAKLALSAAPSDTYDMKNAGYYVPEAIGESVGEYIYTEKQAPLNSRLSRAFSFNLGGPISLDFPQRAYVSGGTEHMRLTIGRDRLSWGGGMMGNMMLGDTLPYHDYFAITFTGTDFFRYQMLISFFTHSQNFETGAGYFNRKGIRFFLAHRFEFSFLENRLTFAVNDAIMYQSEDGTIDFAALNPLMFLHNIFIPGNANSLLTIELEWAPANGLTLYAQAAIDDLPNITEVRAPNYGATPNAWGLMAGIKGTIPQEEDEYLYWGAEFVYTNPYLYHRANAYGLAKSAFDLYYTSSTLITNSSGTNSYLIRYLSFPFGSDTLAAEFKFGYKDPGLLKAEGTITFMAQGIINEFSSTHRYTGTESLPGILATFNPFANSQSGWEISSGVIEYSLIAGASAEWSVLPWLSLDGSVYANLVWNKNNTATSTLFDLQISAGITLEY